MLGPVHGARYWPQCALPNAWPSVRCLMLGPVCVTRWLALCAVPDDWSCVWCPVPGPACSARCLALCAVPDAGQCLWCTMLGTVYVRFTVCRTMTMRIPSRARIFQSAKQKQNRNRNLTELIGAEEEKKRGKETRTGIRRQSGKSGRGRGKEMRTGIRRQSGESGRGRGKERRTGARRTFTFVYSPTGFMNKVFFQYESWIYI